jgi:S-adenosylmethionine hydrolase
MIILLTDFGQSEYVGVMKGIIYSVDAGAQTVDLCHDISPQSIIEASWILQNSYKYFPKGSIFCCIVDPTVGTKRRTLAVKTDHYYFVAPDNGLLWETLKQQNIITSRQIPIPEDASQTFHGRDVFAKAAAIINLGKFNDFTDEIENIQKLELYRNQREGIVVRVDRFGNIITNLPAENKNMYSVKIENKEYQMKYFSNYDSSQENELFLILGSNNTLEISLKNADAGNRLNVKVGQKIKIS